MIVELLVILVLIIANGVFAMSEAALMSSRRARLQQRANEGDAGAEAALKVVNEPSAFLATVQVGITLIGVLLGAFGGATLAEPLAGPLARIEPLAPYATPLAFAIVVALITYISLIIGELVPKQLALNNPERIAAFVAVPMRMLSKIAAPLVKLLSASSNLLIALLGVRRSTEPAVTEEEIKVMIDEGTQTGQFERVERDMVGGVFKLADRSAGALMTPRPDAVWLDIADTKEAIMHRITTSGRSRFPVVENTLDNVIGMVQAKDLLAHQLEGKPFDLRPCLRPPLFVPESISALKLLESFKQAGAHIALVIDEYGGWQGIVTITDVLDEIVGGGYLDSHEPGVVQREDGSWLLDGKLPVTEVEERLALSFPQDRDYETLGGFVMEKMGRIPVSSDAFEYNGMRYEVLDMDGYRVDKVLVSPAHAPEGAE